MIHASSTPANPSIHLGRLQDLIRNGKLPEAKALIEELLQEQPDNLDLRYIDAQLMLFQGDTDDSINAILEVIKKSPEAIKAINLLSSIFYKKGYLGLAIACQSRILKIKNTDLQAYKNKIAIYEALIKEKNEKKYFSGKVCVDSRSMNNLKQKVVILCAGNSSRWNSHLGVKWKQLIPVLNQTLLQRTIRQIQGNHQCEIDVLISSRMEKDFHEVLKNDRVNLVTIKKSYINTETPAAKYLASVEHWNNSGSTVILLGDVWFSDDAIKTILQPRSEPWLAFGRQRPSSCTGYPYGNFFGVRLAGSEFQRKSIVLLDHLYKAGICNAYGGGWAWSQLMRNEDPNIRSVGENFIEIDDFTEDFDCPDDYIRWNINYRKINN